MQAPHRHLHAVRLACVSLLLAALLLIPAPAVTRAADDGPVKLLGHFGGHPSQLTVSGHYLLARDHQGFAVFDVTNPAQLQPYAHVALPATTRAHQVEGSIIYLAVFNVGLVMLDLTDPARPIPLGQLEAHGAEAVVVAWPRAYLGLENGIVLIVNVGDPWSPTTLGSYTGTPESTPVAATAEALYLSEYNVLSWYGGGGSLLAIDIRDPANPQYVERTGPALYRMLIVGGYGYGFTRESRSAGSKVCSVSAWGLKDGWRGCLGDGLPGWVKGFDISDDLLWVLIITPEFQSELHFFELLQPQAPSPRAVYVSQQGGFARAMTFDLQSIYFALDKGGVSSIEVLRLDAEAAPALIGEYRQLGWAQKLIVRGELAYAQTTGGLQIVDLQDLEWPRLRGAFAGGVSDMALVGDTIALIQDTGLALIDVSDPDAPRLRFRMMGIPEQLAADGSTLYALWTRWSVEPIDLSDPDQPRFGAPFIPGLELGTLTAGGGVVAVTAREADGSGLTLLVRWSDINTPLLLARIATKDMGDAALIDRGRLFTGGPVEITAYDIGDPAWPQRLASFTRGFTRSIAVIGDIVYAASSTGIAVIAAAPLATPTLQGVLLKRSSATLGSISTDGELLYVIESGEVTVLRVHPEHLPPPLYLPLMARS